MKSSCTLSARFFLNDQKVRTHLEPLRASLIIQERPVELKTKQKSNLTYLAVGLQTFQQKQISQTEWTIKRDQAERIIPTLLPGALLCPVTLFTVFALLLLLPPRDSASAQCVCVCV